MSLPCTKPCLAPPSHARPGHAQTCRARPRPDWPGLASSNQMSLPRPAMPCTALPCQVQPCPDEPCLAVTRRARPVSLCECPCLVLPRPALPRLAVPGRAPTGHAAPSRIECPAARDAVIVSEVPKSSGETSILGCHALTRRSPSQFVHNLLDQEAAPFSFEAQQHGRRWFRWPRRAFASAGPWLLPETRAECWPSRRRGEPS